jgi:hypothetical protein
LTLLIDRPTGENGFAMRDGHGGSVHLFVLIAALLDASTALLTLCHRYSEYKDCGDFAPPADVTRQLHCRFADPQLI